MTGTSLGGLSDVQTAFLRQRAVHATDGDACIAVGCSGRSVARWKHIPAFKEAYDTVLVNRKAPAVIEPVAREDFPQSVVQTQLALYNAKLSNIFQRLFEIALHDKSSTSALSAIKLIGDWYGIGPEQLTPATLTLVQQKILQWTNVQVVNKDGEPDSHSGEAPLEGTFTEVPSDE